MAAPSDVLLRLRTWARGLPGHLLFERRFRLDTSSHLTLAEHGDGNLHYAPASWRILDRWLPRETVDADDVLLEAGCGKGRLVFIAARNYPFKRVIGLEFSPELVAIAQRNIDRNRRRLRCKDVQLVIADAREWPIPDDVTVVTLYNSFTGEVFDRFIEQMLASVERRPRTIRLLYLNATQQRALEATGRFRLVNGDGFVDDPATDPTVLRYAGVRIYELGPQAAA
jgi:cyclopropane fatty-acyl-phospholipid synthase-like methyltransferase